ncbi:MAG: CCC motif membrane protein [Bacteroidota bacterium]|jgi:hypothetical protein
MEQNQPNQSSFNQSNFNQYAQQQDIPNATGALVLGILSIVFCGLGPILGTIALIISSGGKRDYESNPSQYRVSSYNNLKAGRVCGIVGIIIGGLVWIFYAFAIFFSVAALSRLGGLD